MWKGEESRSCVVVLEEGMYVNVRMMISFWVNVKDSLVDPKTDPTFLTRHENLETYILTPNFGENLTNALDRPHNL